MFTQMFKKFLVLFMYYDVMDVCFFPDYSLVFCICDSKTAISMLSLQTVNWIPTTQTIKPINDCRCLRIHYTRM